MTEEYVVNMFREAFYTMLLLSAPILIVTLVVGLLISIFQAATSIQEFTLTFVPKAVVVAIILVLLMPWMIQTMTSYTINLYQSIPTIAK